MLKNVNYLPAPSEHQMSNPPKNIDYSAPGSISICFHMNTIYLKSGLVYMTMPDFNSWSFLVLTPFTSRIGQSMTSTPSGLVFFGGFDGNEEYYNDLWIYSENNWRNIICDVCPRSNHAACCTEDGCLLVSGGSNQNKVFSDFYKVDLKSGETKKIETQKEIPLQFHTITHYQKDLFFIAGGKNIQQVITSDLFSFSIDSGNIDIVKVAASIPGFINHSAQIILGNLWISNMFAESYPDSHIWIFCIRKQLWIPFSLKNGTRNRSFGSRIPLFVFMSNSLSNFKALHFIDDKGQNIMTMPIFSEYPTVDTENSIELIEFMANQINDALITIDSLPDKSTNDLYSESILQMRHADLVLRSARSFIRPYPLPSFDRTSGTRELVQKYNVMKKDFTTKINGVSQDCYRLSQVIELQTLLDLDSKVSTSVPSIEEKEWLEEKSKELASYISSTRKDLEDRESLNFEIEKEVINRQQSLLAVRLQMAEQSLIKKNLTEEINSSEIELFSLLTEIASLRAEELRLKEIGEDVRSVAQKLVVMPTKSISAAELAAKWDKILQNMNKAIQDLDSNQVPMRRKSAKTKAKTLVSAIEDVKNWIEDSQSYILHKPKRNKSRKLSIRKERRDSGVDTMELFLSLVGDPDDFLRDVNELLKRIRAEIRNLKSK